MRHFKLLCLSLTAVLAVSFANAQQTPAKKTNKKPANVVVLSDAKGNTEVVKPENLTASLVENKTVTNNTNAPVTITTDKKAGEAEKNTAVLGIPITYVFTGNGNWSLTSNWQNNLKPTTPLLPGNSVVINHQSGGTCVLDVPFTFSTNTTLTVNPGKTFSVQGLTLN